MEKPEFDVLKNLAENDPEAFEALRKDLIENLIERSNGASRKRMRGLQFVIDAKRAKARNPTRALVEIQALMWASFERLNKLLRTGSVPYVHEPSGTPPDNVLAFRRAQ